MTAVSGYELEYSIHGSEVSEVVEIITRNQGTGMIREADHPIPSDVPLTSRSTVEYFVPSSLM